jgi:hypothetical protein
MESPLRTPLLFVFASGAWLLASLQVGCDGGERKRGGCDRDSDCKGDRVCVGDRCVEPKPTTRATAPSVTTAPARTAAPAVTAAPKPAVPRYEGAIGSEKGKEAFAAFLEKHDGKVVEIDVNLSEEQHEDRGIAGQNTFYVTLTTDNPETKMPSGYALSIDLSQGRGNFRYDERLASLRLQSHLVVAGIVGPNQGILSITARPVLPPASP